MSNFCPHCGTAVSEKNAMNCFSCGKLMSGSSENTKNDSFDDSKEKLFNFAKNVKELSIKASADLRSDETKAMLKDFANQAQNFASEKTKDLKEEFEKINEARKATANEAKDFESNSKLETSKVVSLSFWSKLTSKQKLIFIALPLFFFVSIMAVLENSTISEKDAQVRLSKYQTALCNFEDWAMVYKLRETSGTLGSLASENSIAKKAGDKLISAQKELFEDGKLLTWMKSDPNRADQLKYMMSVDSLTCPTRKNRGFN